MVNKMHLFEARRGGAEKDKDRRRKRRRRVSLLLISHLAFKNTMMVSTKTLTHMLKHRGLRCVLRSSILQVLGNWSVVHLEKTADFIGSANRTFVCHVSLFQGARGARHRESSGSIVGTDPAIPECIQPRR